MSILNYSKWRLLTGRNEEIMVNKPKKQGTTFETLQVNLINKYNIHHKARRLAEGVPISREKWDTLARSKDL